MLGLAAITPTGIQAQSKWTSYRIMIDPGHGGSDPGASGPSAPHEAELALRCATELKSQITGTKLGGTVKLTRTSNTTLSLTARKQQSVSYDPYIFCSIHLNAFNGSAHGTETWYYWTTGNSLKLANKVHAELISQMGRTNRGVKRNGWTVITGSSSVPAILTEGLFVDNRTEWELINQNTKQGFKNWVNGHLYGFYDHFKTNLGYNVVNPKTTTTVTDPTLKVNTSSLYFNATEGQKMSLSFTVAGTNLSGNIAVTSNNSAFTVDKSSLAATGGTVNVTFNPSGYPFGEFSGATITVKNTTNSKTYSAKVALSGKVSPKPLNFLSEIWNLSEKKGTKEKMGYDASKIRNFDYNGGKLYCVYDHSEILVINAQTGEKLGFLNKGSVIAGGTLTLCDVRVLDGHIVACNLATAANNEELRIYCWDNDNAEPKLIKTITNLRGATRLGDCMQLSGKFDTNMYVTFANDLGSETRIIEFNCKNGSEWSGTYHKVTTDGTEQLKTGGTTRAYRRAEGKYVIDGKDCFPTWVEANASGILVKTTSIDTGETWGSSHHETTWGGERYTGNIVFNGKEYDSSGNMINEKNYKGARVRLGIDTNKDYKRVEQVADYPAEGLGDVSRNTNATADCVLNSDGSKYFEVWVLSTTHGMAYFRTGTPPDHGVTPIVPSTPAIAVDKKSLDLTATVGETASATVTVTGSALTGDITATLSGTDKAMFSINNSTIAKATASGKIKVTYSPSEAGNHTATLTLKSDGATSVKVALTGTGNEPLVFNENIDKLTEGWVASTNAGTTSQYPWLETSTSGEFTRDIQALNGKLYAINARAWGSAPSIQIVDGTTGERIGTLNIEGVTAGRVVLGGISAIGGKIIASNSAASNHALKVYKWDSDTSKPSVWFEDATHGGVTLGDQINTSGDMTSGAVWFSDGNKVYKYAVTNGTVNTTPTVITLATPAGTINGSCDVLPETDGSFWVVGKDTYPTRYKADGTVWGSISAAGMGSSTKNKQGTSAALIPFGTRRYMAALTYVNESANFSGGAIALSDITDGAGNVTAPIGIYPASGLGTTSNSQMQSSVTHELTNNDHTLNLWVAVPYQGVAYYKYEGETNTGVEDVIATMDGREWSIVINGSWITTNGGDINMIRVFTAAGSLTAQSAGEAIDASQLRPGVYIVQAVDANGASRTIKMLNK